jgi:transposase InsO family protein
MARQLTEAFGWEAAPKYLIRDRDSIFSELFKRRVRTMGIRDRPASFRSPWQNGHTERLIGSIRRECLDHVVIFNARHLRHVLLAYVQYYNLARTHLALDKDAPIVRDVQSVSAITSTSLLGGLHHRYGRI